jgi:hypothetical protein
MVSNVLIAFVTGSLRQQVCWDIVRILAQKYCLKPKVANTVKTRAFVQRVEGAARKLYRKDGRFKHIQQWQGWESTKWASGLKVLRGGIEYSIAPQK